MRKIFIALVILFTLVVGAYILYSKTKIQAPEVVAPTLESEHGEALPEMGTCSLNEVGLPKDGCGGEEASSSVPSVN